MPKPIIRVYSHYSRDAVLLLSNLIRCARKEKKKSVQEIATRAGISRGSLQRIEKGDLRCEIGVVFEVADILNIKLFDLEHNALKQQIGYTEAKLTLLPKSIRKTQQVDNNDV